MRFKIPLILGGSSFGLAIISDLLYKTQEAAIKTMTGYILNTSSTALIVFAIMAFIFTIGVDAVNEILIEHRLGKKKK